MTTLGTIRLRRGSPPAKESPLSPDKLADLGALAFQREEVRQFEQTNLTTQRRRNWHGTRRSMGSLPPFWQDDIDPEDDMTFPP